MQLKGFPMENQPIREMFHRISTQKLWAREDQGLHFKLSLELGNEEEFPTQP